MVTREAVARYRKLRRETRDGDRAGSLRRWRSCHGCELVPPRGPRERGAPSWSGNEPCIDHRTLQRTGEAGETSSPSRLGTVISPRLGDPRCAFLDGCGVGVRTRTVTIA